MKTLFTIYIFSLFLIVLSAVFMGAESFGKETAKPQLVFKPELKQVQVFCIHPVDFLGSYVKARKLRPLIAKRIVINKKIAIKAIFVNDYGDAFSIEILNVKGSSGLKVCIFAEIINGSLNIKNRKLEYNGPLSLTTPNIKPKQ